MIATAPRMANANPSATRTVDHPPGQKAGINFRQFCCNAEINPLNLETGRIAPDRTDGQARPFIYSTFLDEHRVNGSAPASCRLSPEGPASKTQESACAKANQRCRARCALLPSLCGVTAEQ